MDVTDQEMMPILYQMPKNTKTRTKRTKKVNIGVFTTQSFRGVGIHNFEIATHNCKFYIPKPLCKNVIGWYHT